MGEDVPETGRGFVAGLALGAVPEAGGVALGAVPEAGGVALGAVPEAGGVASLPGAGPEPGAASVVGAVFGALPWFGPIGLRGPAARRWTTR
ncbi:hypothetical protein [Streptomyces lydicamycinicus]|uniref:hypothetical protein n=1 Tax=Streptomyces lydicamycinicus TaxID=1546107 RepID=UPI003C2AE078